MGWGVFAGGLAGGFERGMRIGKTMSAMQDEKELRDVAAKGAEEARIAHGKAINSAVTDTQAPSQSLVSSDTNSSVAQAEPVKVAAVETRELPARVESSGLAPHPAIAEPVRQAPIAEPQPIAQRVESAGIVPQQVAQAQPVGRYLVGDQRFDSPDAAREAAKKKVGSINDYMMNTVVPKMQEAYIARGDVASAEKLGQYMESRRGREAVNIFGKAMTSMLTGDTENGVKQFGEYYNKFIDDGVDFAGHSIGEDGRVNIKLKTKGSDKTRDMSLSRGEILQLGMAYDPAKIYASLMERQAANDKQAAEYAKENRAEARDIRKEERADVRDIAKSKRTQENAIDLKSYEHSLDMEKIGVAERRRLDTQRSILKENGFSDEEIRRMTPAMLRINEFKKTTDPDERRAIITSELLKSDMSFPRLSEAEQRKKVDQVMRVMNIDTGSYPTATPSATPGPQSNMRPMFDTRTGKIVMRPTN